MKNKILILLIIVIGIFAIVGGVVLGGNNGTEEETNNKPKENPPVVVDENYEKHYQTPTPQEGETIKNTSEEEVKNNYKNMGFDKVECSNGACTMSKPVGAKGEENDSLQIAFYEGNVDFIGIRMVYLKTSFNPSVVTKDLNAVLNNYIGYQLTDELTSSAYEEIKNISDDTNYVKEFTVGNYTYSYTMGQSGNNYVCSLQVFKISRIDQ